MSKDADIERGARAERLLNDPAMTQAFADVEAAIIERWRLAPMRDREGAHELKLMLKLLGDVRANLEQALSDGKLAVAELRQNERRALSPAEWRGFPTT